MVEHFADFQMYDPWVTRELMVEDLMAHRSCLPSHAGDLQTILGFDRDHIIRSLRYIKPASSFRSQFAYQNGLFLVAGALIHKYTGQSWEQNIQKRIFEPLGMSASSTSYQALQQAKNRATGHEKRKDGTVEILSWDWPYHEAPYIHGPAGGINSNIMDMSKWLRLQLGKGKFQGKRLISEENLKFLHTPKTIIGPRWGEWHYYGEAWGYTPKHPYPLIWHTGGTQGNKTMVAMVPEAGIGMVILSNLVTDMPQALAFYFYDRYFHNSPRDWSQELLKESNQAKGKGKLPPRPSSPAPPLPLDRYIGSYSHQAYSNLAISLGKDFLVATLGPKKCRAVLRPWDRDTFLFYFPDIAKGEEQELASFKTGPDGRPQSLFLEWDGGTEFKRLAEKTSLLK